ncbi:reticulon-1-A-like [Centruroides vittatus]|uniref:reticulon-1-A-like n=1 Tax=Centruroides sculpturatus TaxID=218467 RepID=UPI000C6D2447|nr:reticulon-1-A-like [Centruroides sculpturatus]
MDTEEVTTTSTEVAEKPEPVKANEVCKSCCPMAWFKAEHMHPSVRDMIYWRDIRKSGVVFGVGLMLLLSFTYCSVISVVAYTALMVLGVTTGFRIYKNVLQAVQKSGNGHPFKEYLDMDITLPSNRVHEYVDAVMVHFNASLQRLRSLFLVEDLIDSLKLGMLLWCMTYIGAWFNGMTLVVLAYVAFFSLPKVYETYKVQIDKNIDMVCVRVKDIMATVKAKIPQGKKEQ